MSDYIAHYASPYYDPEKASEYNHEYYEAHKKLKGRTTSTAGLTDEGKEIASTVKANIEEERDKAIEVINADYASQIEELERKIAELRELGESERAAKKEEIQTEIDEIRESLTYAKELLNAALEERRSQISSENEEAADRTARENEQEKQNAQRENASRKEQVANQNERLREQISRLGNSRSARLRKAELQKEIENNNEQLQLDNASTTAASNARISQNKENLRQLRNANKEDLSAYSKEIRSTINEVSKSSQEGIKELRKQLSEFNSSSRATQKSDIDECRSKIKALREQNRQAKTELKDYYKELYLDELDSIRSEYSKNKSKSSGGGSGYTSSTTTKTETNKEPKQKKKRNSGFITTASTNRKTGSRYTRGY